MQSSEIPEDPEADEAVLITYHCSFGGEEVSDLELGVGLCPRCNEWRWIFEKRSKRTENSS